MKEKILLASEDLFYRFGFTKSTSDDIAKQAGLSKRTLYKYFQSKQEILETFIRNKFEKLRSELDSILKQKHDFPEKIREITTLIAVSLSGLSPFFLDDLKINVPEQWQKISDFRRELVQDFFPGLLDEGIREGHFKPFINKGVAVLVMLNTMEIIINPGLVRNLPPKLSANVPDEPDKIFNFIFEIIYDGIHVD